MVYIKKYEVFETDKKLSVGYHVSPIKNYDKILKTGLIRRNNEKGIYVWDSLKMAKWFVDLSADDDALRDKSHVIFSINISGLPLSRDNETEDMSQWSSEFKPGQEGGGWIISIDKIEPDRIISNEIIHK